MASGAQLELFVSGPRPLDFAEAFALQVQLRDECIACEGRRNYLLLVTHPHTISLGRAGRHRDVLAARERLSQLGVAVLETNRGGEVTYHGPGQLVAYPVVSLVHRGRDLHRYLRDLEAWLVRLCRSYGVAAHADSPHTGVWVGDRKIASIGIAVRRWVSYHGVALNVSTDLSYFGLIVPCGLPGVAMTSLERELGSAPPFEEVAERAATYFAEDLDMRLTRAELRAVEAT
jgi:lipoate-protein ligase B